MQPESVISVDNVDAWLQRSLGCVSCDGTPDMDALDIVQFAHDLAVARTVIASIRVQGVSGDVLLSGIRVPHPYNTRRLARLTVAETPPGSGEWRALAGMAPHTDEYVLGSGTMPLSDDTVAALLALSARSRVAPFETVAGCDVASTGARAWLMRMGRAQALRTCPWDLSAIDQEVGLARVLVEAMAVRHSRHAALLPVRLSGHGLSAKDASAYKSAIALWDQYALVLHRVGTLPPIFGDDPSYGLRVFITAAERMQATPGFYLAFVAPAIAARLQPDLDKLAEAAPEPTDPTFRQQ